MVSLLRKKRFTQSTQPESNRELRHSLSLPDLTTPLLDPASWEEIPDFPTSIPSLSNSKPRTLFSPSSGTGRNRSPSLVTGPPGSPVAYHKPFGNWQVVKHHQETPPLPPIQHRGDFRKSTWSRDSHTTDPKASTVYAPTARRRKKGKVAEKLNIMVVGGKGVGKTSFINLLRSSLTERPFSPKLQDPTHSQRTPSSPTSPGPPITPSSIKRTLTPTHTTILHRPKSTVCITSEIVMVDRPNEKLELQIIDTPGLDLRVDDGLDIHGRQRERGVQALMRVAEERFDDVLKEESKVVRRQLSGGSDLLHLWEPYFHVASSTGLMPGLYLIDARAVLHPVQAEVDLDWSASIQTRDQAEDLQDVQPRLNSTEIETIRRLSIRMTVLPILTHTDALCRDELAAVQLAVRQNLAEAFREDEGRGFSLFGNMATEDDGRQSPSLAETSLVSTRNARPPTPALSADDDSTPEMPFSLFAPSSGTSRSYPWGRADVSVHSDLDALREAILDLHAKSLRSTTREVLYERYRTEKLLARRARKGISDDSVDI